MTNADVSGIINSDAIQSVLKDAKAQPKRTRGQKANPLRNKVAMARLNPYSSVLRDMRKKQAGVKRKITKQEKKDKATRSKKSKDAVKALLSNVDTEVDALVSVYREQIASMNIKP